MAANSFRIRGIGPQSAIDTMQISKDRVTRMAAKSKFKYDLKHSARH